MKILLINNCHYKRGGADIAYFNTGDLLKKNGHNVFYFSSLNDKNKNSSFDKYFIPQIDYRNSSLTKKIVSIPSFIYNRKAAHLLEKQIVEIKPDIAHIHLFMGSLTSSILPILKKNNIPILHTVHDYRLICPAYVMLDGNNKICEKCIDKSYYKCIQHKCSENKITQSSILALDAYFRKYFINPIEYIDRFIFVSEFIMNKHIEFNGEYFPKSEMIYNFIPEFENLNNQNSKGSYLLYYGRLSKEKGITTLIQAAERCKLPLKIVGTGPLYDTYREYDFHNVSFLGYKSGNELWNLVLNSSFVVVPSEWYENNPLTILEAYSLGKPVIGAQIGGIPEILIDNETGFLFKSGDLISLCNALLKAQQIDVEEYNNMSNKALSFAKSNFSEEIHYKKLISTYNKVIKQ